MWAAFDVLHQHLSDLWVLLHGCWNYIFVFKFEQSSLLFSLKNSRPCQDLNPGPPRYQPDMPPIELSWLGHKGSNHLLEWLWQLNFSSQFKLDCNGNDYSTLSFCLLIYCCKFFYTIIVNNNQLTTFHIANSKIFSISLSISIPFIVFPLKPGSFLRSLIRSNAAYHSFIIYYMCSHS